jgi:uncharacterized protein
MEAFVRGRRLGEMTKRSVFVLLLALSLQAAVRAQETGGGTTGWDAKRPVMAAACETGCPWGELGDFVREALRPYGYDVILCRNCNRWYGPGLVSGRGLPPPLDAVNLADGVTERVDAPVDFGVTSSAMLAAAYHRTLAGKGPYPNLRLVAKVEDPFYFLVAVRGESGLRGLADIRTRRMAARIAGSGADLAAILKFYGIDPDSLAAWGGRTGVPADEALQGRFDVVAGFLASPAMNPESSLWTALSQKFDLVFQELPDALLERIAAGNVDAEFVVARNRLLRGVDRPIRTLGRSGEAFFVRDDAPEAAVHDLARAIDENRGALKWFIRVYTYDPATVWRNFGVPLHPGAERYYREAGYIK